MKSSATAWTSAMLRARLRPAKFVRSLAILPQAPLLSLTDQKKLLELRKAAELAAELHPVEAQTKVRSRGMLLKSCGRPARDRGRALPKT